MWGVRTRSFASVCACAARVHVGGARAARAQLSAVLASAFACGHAALWALGAHAGTRAALEAGALVTRGRALHHLLPCLRAAFVVRADTEASDRGPRAARDVNGQPRVSSSRSTGTTGAGQQRAQMDERGSAKASTHLATGASGGVGGGWGEGGAEPWTCSNRQACLHVCVRVCCVLCVLRAVQGCQTGSTVGHGSVQVGLGIGCKALSWLTR